MEGFGEDLGCGYLFELEFDAVECGGFVDFVADAYDGFEDVQHLLFVEQFALLDLIFGGFVVGEEIFLVD
jgi:hypothetical protein